MSNGIGIVESMIQSAGGSRTQQGLLTMVQTSLRTIATQVVHWVIVGWGVSVGPLWADSASPMASRGMVVSQSTYASDAGVAVLREGGTAVDAAVTTALVLAVTHPAAGNIGGGGFLVFRPAKGQPITFDFREQAPAAAHANMWLDENGEYDHQSHHSSHLSVGVPGTVAGLHLAWSQQGKLPWKRLVQPAIELARDGFPISHGLARDLHASRDRFAPYPAAIAQFTKDGAPYQAGEILKQPDLAATLERIAAHGADGFYRGRTAELIVAEMQAGGGIITMEDLASYSARVREPVVGTYRGYDIISMPPPSSGGVTLIQMLNILEGFDLRESGFGAAQTMHLMAESMRRAYRNRALHLGDPDFNPEMPVAQLTSKGLASQLREQIDPQQATPSTLSDVPKALESPETTHFSVVDADRNAVALTYTLEYSYGSGIVVRGGGFLLNNEMGDFNPIPGTTTESGLIGTRPNLTAPGKRMLSSMTPTIVAQDGELFLVTGSPGGRTIINTVLQTIVNTIDHQMNAQTAVDAGRFHHQWFPDRIQFEHQQFSPDTLKILLGYGHKLHSIQKQGCAHVILVEPETGVLQAGVDRRRPDTAAAGY